MSNLNDLKQYNSKLGRLKRCESKLREHKLKLENYDKLKAATLSDMPTHRDDSECNSIVERSLMSRQDLEKEVLMLELEIAELNSFIVNVDSLLDCVDYRSKWILEAIYKTGLYDKRHKELLHKKYVDDVKIVSYRHFKDIVSEAHRKYNRIK